MDVDIESVGSLHLERCLHTSLREWRLRGIRGDGFTHVTSDLREARLHVVILLGVVIAWNPPCRVVTCHGKLCVLGLYHEIGQILLLRKLISESHAVVIDTESEIHKPAVRRFLHLDEQLVVMIANVARLAPYGLPSLIKSRCGGLVDPKLIHQRVFFVEFYTQLAGLNDFLPFIGYLIDRRSLLVQLHVQHDVPVGRLLFDGAYGQGHHHCHCGYKYLFHISSSL